MPAPYRPDSFDLKVDRAREHQEAFETEAKAWIEGNPYIITDEPDPEPAADPRHIYPNTQRRRFRFSQIDEVPRHLSLIAGDCVHNLRSALDHLALALGKAHTPNMTDTQVAESEFPIYHMGPMTADVERRKIGCMASGAKQVIKALQPYHRGSQYRTHPLWQIQELDRIDKHRALTVCGMVTEEWFGFEVTEDWNVRRPDGFPFVACIGGEMKLDAVVLRYAARPVDPEREVKVKPAVPGQVSFAEGTAAPLQPAIKTLDSLCEYVRYTVIPAFAKFL